MEFYVIATKQHGLLKMISKSSQPTLAFWTTEIDRADQFHKRELVIERAEEISKLSNEFISILKIGILEVIDVENLLGNS